MGGEAQIPLLPSAGCPGSPAHAFICTPSLASTLCLPCPHRCHAALWSLTSSSPVPVTSTSTPLQPFPQFPQSRGLAPQSRHPSSSSDHASHPSSSVKLPRDFQSSTSSKPTGHLSAHPSPSWAPWSSHSAAPSIFITHPHRCLPPDRARALGQGHPPPSPPCCTVTVTTPAEGGQAT